MQELFFVNIKPLEVVIMLVSRWCYQYGPLTVIGQFSLNAIDCKTRVNFAIGYWSVSIYDVDKTFVRRPYYSSH